MSTGNLGNEHPGLNIRKLKEDLTIEEVQVKIKEIVERLNFAYRMSNQPLINQLTMVKATYTRVQLEMLEEMFGDDKNQDVSGKIDIS